jgi:5-formyltetrahydrofolate cyclo-ligase
LKPNPDAPQLPVRRAALAAGKHVFMAVPRLRDAKPFLRLRDDATIRARGAVPTAIEELPPIDLIVCGTVAVNREGVRVGKGGGYSDLEFALLVERGLVGDATTIVTTVHALQVVDEQLPETEHDFRVDIVVTPTRRSAAAGGSTAGPALGTPRRGEDRGHPYPRPPRRLAPLTLPAALPAKYERIGP